MSSTRISITEDVRSAGQRRRGFDRALYPQLQQEFLEFAPQAHLQIMERSGSCAHIEEPKVVFEALRKFWRVTKIPGRGARGASGSAGHGGSGRNVNQL